MKSSSHFRGGAIKKWRALERGGPSFLCPRQCAAGPLVATTAFAHASPFGLYLGLSGFTLLCHALFLSAPADSGLLVPSSR